MAKADALPVQIELSGAQYLMLLKNAPKRSRVSARLIAAVDQPGKGTKGMRHLFTGFRTDALSLKPWPWSTRRMPCPPLSAR